MDFFSISGRLHKTSRIVRAVAQIWGADRESCRLPATVQAGGTQGDHTARDQKGAQDQGGRRETQGSRHRQKIAQSRRHHR